MVSSLGGRATPNFMTVSSFIHLIYWAQTRGLGQWFNKWHHSSRRKCWLESILFIQISRWQYEMQNLYVNWLDLCITKEKWKKIRNLNIFRAVSEQTRLPSLTSQYETLNWRLKSLTFFSGPSYWEHIAGEIPEVGLDPRGCSYSATNS